MSNPLMAVSEQIAAAVRAAGDMVVAVDGGSRFGAGGVLWRPGLVVTTEHTLKHEEGIAVTASGGLKFEASVAGRDAGTDLALLKLPEPHAAGPELSTADVPDPGSLVLAVGRSAETGVIAAMGVVSAVGGPRRTWRGGRLDRYVRLDMALYPGSSGSAVIDPEGRVIGLLTPALSRLAGLAVPAATVNRVVDELLSRGRIARGYLGVGLQPVGLPEHLRSETGVDSAAGLIVLSVEAGGPAERGGILIGDILIGVDGRTVADTDDVQEALEGKTAGTAVSVAVLRGGVRREIPVTVGERPGRTR